MPARRRMARTALGRPRKTYCLGCGDPRRLTAHSRLANAMSAFESDGPTLVHG